MPGLVLASCYTFLGKSIQILSGIFLRNLFGSNISLSSDLIYCDYQRDVELICTELHLLIIIFSKGKSEICLSNLTFSQYLVEVESKKF